MVNCTFEYKQLSCKTIKTTKLGFWFPSENTVGGKQNSFSKKFPSQILMEGNQFAKMSKYGNFLGFLPKKNEKENNFFKKKKSPSKNFMEGN